MFMTTTLGHYQLPLQQTAGPALATEIGAGQRSLWLRPLTAPAAATELAAAQVVSLPEKVTPPFAFKQWLQRLQDYEAGAARIAAEAPEPKAEPEPQPEPRTAAPDMPQDAA